MYGVLHYHLLSKPHLAVDNVSHLLAELADIGLQLRNGIIVSSETKLCAFYQLISALRIAIEPTPSGHQVLDDA